ncbi:hypothetical protein ACQVP2_23045 [Methylobacterium aquaticum]|uniref:hypothetical protein n=1 Tax=Methylobacterium aquaticum TaxID=270351 RepID=UPI003D17D933
MPGAQDSVRTHAALRVKGVSRRDLGVPDLFGRVVNTTTDPATSHSGFSFGALAANRFAGDVAGNVATPETLVEFILGNPQPSASLAQAKIRPVMLSPLPDRHLCPPNPEPRRTRRPAGRGAH